MDLGPSLSQLTSSGMPESIELSSLVFVERSAGAPTSDGRQERRQGSLLLVLSFLRLLGMVPTLLGREKSLIKSLWKSSSFSKMLWQLFCRFWSSILLECTLKKAFLNKNTNQSISLIPENRKCNFSCHSDVYLSQSKGHCVGILSGQPRQLHYLMTWRSCSLSQNSWL